MGRRLVPVVLLVLLGILYGQLWLGRGSLPDVANLQQKLQEQNARNAQAQLANDRLAAEVQDLKEGLDMVEEKARGELGMVKPNEILVQYTAPASSADASPPQKPAPQASGSASAPRPAAAPARGRSGPVRERKP